MRSAQQLSWGGCSDATVVSTRIRHPRLRSVRLCPRGAAEPVEASPEASYQAKPLVVKSIPQARSAAPPPEPVPIEHSPAFLLRNRRDTGDGAVEARKRQQPDEAFSGNAVLWALKKADESLDEIEENPPEIAKALYDISRGPVGTATSKGVTTMAKVTWQVGTEAAKVAVPVGKWALQQGFKLAVTAVSKGLESSSSSKRKGRD